MDKTLFIDLYLFLKYQEQSKIFIPKEKFVLLSFYIFFIKNKQKKTERDIEWV